jgi:hypothetical protein
VLVSLTLKIDSTNKDKVVRLPKQSGKTFIFLPTMDIRNAPASGIAVKSGIIMSLAISLLTP